MRTPSGATRKGTQLDRIANLQQMVRTEGVLKSSPGAMDTGLSTHLFLTTGADPSMAFRVSLAKAITP